MVHAILLLESSFIAPLPDTKPPRSEAEYDQLISQHITQQTHVLTSPSSTDIQSLLQHTKRVWVGHLYIPYIVKRKLPEQEWPSHLVQVVLDALYPEGWAMYAIISDNASIMQSCSALSAHEYVTLLKRLHKDKVVADILLYYTQSPGMRSACEYTTLSAYNII